MSNARRRKPGDTKSVDPSVDEATGVFISHATADKVLVDALVDLLQTGVGIPHDKIFCTSLEGLGIPEGENFADFIKEKLRGAGHVIMVITPSYFESAFCLCELGATWIQSGNAFPLVVPPLDYADMKAVLAGVQGGRITEPAKLDNLRDRLAGGVPTARWNMKRDLFLRDFEQRLAASVPGPSKVPAEKYEELKGQYSALLDEVGETEAEIRELKQQVEELKALKDKAQVAEVLARYSDESEQFDALIEKVRTAFDRVPSIVAEALYYEERSEPFIIKTGFDRDDERIDAARSAEQNGYIGYRDAEVTLNHTDRKVDRAATALAELREFLNGASSDFSGQFEDDYDYLPDLGNRRFWRQFFNL